MEEFKREEKSLKSVIILLTTITVVVGVIYYYFIGSKNITIPENNFTNQVQNLVNDDNKVSSNNGDEINPEVIIDEAEKLDREEEEIDKMIDDLGELNI